VDDRGRLVISAQDFVAENGVVSVFGFGGAYMRERHHLAVVVFAREQMTHQDAQLFAPLASTFKTLTMDMVEKGRLFR
jgi:hypothetical protein